MQKVKNLSLIMDKIVQITVFLKDGSRVNVDCEFIDAERDRLYLKFPSRDKEYEQYFYNEREVFVRLCTADGYKFYRGLVLYEPQNSLIVVEYDDTYKKSQRRQALRVDANLSVNLEYEGEFYKVISENISCTGMKLISRYKFPDNSIVKLDFRLDAESEPVSVEAKLLRSIVLEDNGLNALLMEFISLKDNDEKKIAKMCYDIQSRGLGRKIH